jgi:hypothetical protein
LAVRTCVTQLLQDGFWKREEELAKITEDQTTQLSTLLDLGLPAIEYHWHRLGRRSTTSWKSHLCKALNATYSFTNGMVLAFERHLCPELAWAITTPRHLMTFVKDWHQYRDRGIISFSIRRLYVDTDLALPAPPGPSACAQWEFFRTSNLVTHLMPMLKLQHRSMSSQTQDPTTTTTTTTTPSEEPESKKGDTRPAPGEPVNWSDVRERITQWLCNRRFTLVVIYLLLTLLPLAVLSGPELVCVACQTRTTDRCNTCGVLSLCKSDKCRQAVERQHSVACSHLQEARIVVKHAYDLLGVRLGDEDDYQEDDLWPD